jgi:hypothetical protein
MENKQIQPQNWFLTVILEGLQRLMCLSLESQPAAEVIPGTASAWVEALWPGKVWLEERDVPRIREAFRQLSLRSTRWPAPAQFMEALPRSGGEVALKLKKMETDAERAKAAVHVSEILEKLNPLH